MSGLGNHTIYPVCRNYAERHVGNRLPTLRATTDAGANASVLPIFSVASLVGSGAVVAAVPAFEIVCNWVLGIKGRPLVSLAIAANILACAHRLGLGRPDRRARS